MAVASPQITNAYRLDEGRVMFVLGFPLLIVAFIIYNIVAFVTPGVSWTAHHVMSGRDWVLTW
jgi:hypothetical protein